MKEQEIVLNVIKDQQSDPLHYKFKCNNLNECINIAARYAQDSLDQSYVQKQDQSDEKDDFQDQNTNEQYGRSDFIDSPGMRIRDGKISVMRQAHIENMLVQFSRSSKDFEDFQQVFANSEFSIDIAKVYLQQCWQGLTSEVQTFFEGSSIKEQFSSKQ